MPSQFNIIENLTLAVLAGIIFFLLYKKAWTDKALRFILINALYSLFTVLITLVYPITSPAYDIISNLTMHIDTLSGLGFFYYLWNINRYHRFLVYTVSVVLLVWFATFFIMRDFGAHSWTLLLPSIWYVIVGMTAFYLMYTKADFQQTRKYGSRFLLITGFVFYNFIYIVIEICYIYFKGVGNINDAWKINYWSYFLFRVMMFAGVIFWYARPGIPRNKLSAISK
ncbi:hypothetical protein [Flavihumibacter petaseus]|uniref:Uncharacterized protein n=1 Tax=Flavihumibacter petaseus NBRC 106054 TaxID=1220578 RepID=A0A0E9N1M9_9BACT|nr:hypothetical protein [Flavihumibacter petaseus]GAO43683.1 hypothetical protein FPE01S_02_07890 [Flavihumibacter petaseus NBRC 106054]